MIRIDKGTLKELIVLTSTTCIHCKKLFESNKCQDLQFTKNIVLSEFFVQEKLINKMIFKSYNPLKSYQKLLTGNELIDEDIDFSKETIEQENENTKMFNFLREKFNVVSTPSFYIKTGDNIEPVIFPEQDIVEIIENSLK